MSEPEGARVIVIGNEKGGAGKSTIAIHLVCALLHAGAKVALMDLDLRQQSCGRFLSNRRAWSAANGVVLPMPHEVTLGDDGVKLAALPSEEIVARFASA